MFGRRRDTTAREALFDPEFACTAPGVAGVHIDYDPALWVRCPGVGQDRTDWRDRVLEAYATDLAWAGNSYERRALGAALDQVANDPLPHTANFLMIDGKLKSPAATAHLDVGDEELMLLEHGDPEVFLRFHDIDPGLNENPKDYYQGWRWVTHMSPEEGGLLIHVRAHKPLATAPPLHLTGFGFCGGGKQSAQMAALFSRTRVRTDDDQLL